MAKTQPRSNIEWDEGPAQLTLRPERDTLLKFFVVGIVAWEVLWEHIAAKWGCNIFRRTMFLLVLPQFKPWTLPVIDAWKYIWWGLDSVKPEKPFQM